MAGRWFYRLMNEEFGPVVEEQVVELIRSQILTESDEVRSEHSRSWQTLIEVEFFHSERGQTETDHMDVAQTLDDLCFEFAESSLPDVVKSTQSVRQYHGSCSTQEKKDGGVVDLRAGQQLRPIVPDSSEFRFEAIEPATVSEKRTVICKSQRDVIESKPKQVVSEAARMPRRRKAKPNDPLMEEIIRELSERSKAVDPSKVLIDGAGTSTAGSARSDGRMSVPTQTSSPSISSLTSAPTTDRSQSTATAGAVQSPRPAVSHYSLPRKPIISKGASFQMPEGKTLWTAGGAVSAVLLAASVCFGWISAPFGTSGGALPGSAGVVVSCYLQYNLLGTGIPDHEDWAAFQTSVQQNVKPIVESAGGSSDNVAEAGKILVEMASLQPTGDATRLHEIGKQLQPLMNQITGTP